MGESGLNDDALAIALLCAVEGRESAASSKPLSAREYDTLARALHEWDTRPSALLTMASEAVTQVAAAAALEPGRLRDLLARRAAIGMLLERVTSGGMWVLTRADAAYPQRLKRRLGPIAPPLLYGAGPMELLAVDGGIGVVGSRELDADGEAFARRVGEQTAAAKLVLVSGGAAGADEIGMRAALDAGGVTIGILGKDLARSTSRAPWRKAIADGRCTLVAMVSPWAGFNAGNLMARNKLIYAMSRAVFVASSDTKGGTWTGALENQRHGWSRLMVRDDASVPEGCHRLVQHGGQPISVSGIDAAALAAMTDGPRESTPEPEQLTLG